MTGNLLLRISATTLLATMIFSADEYIAQPQEEPEIRSPKTISQEPPLAVFASVLPRIKAKSHVPVLLPSQLPPPITKAKHAVIGTAKAGKYGIALYYEREPDGGYFGFAASFSAEGRAKFNPRELTNFEPVSLAHHLHGFFRAVSCGGSCAPANLWWEQDGALYTVQLELSPSLSEKSQQKSIVAVVDSAILGGPR
jgi:hypothetical protein